VLGKFNGVPDEIRQDLAEPARVDVGVEVVVEAGGYGDLAAGGQRGSSGSAMGGGRSGWGVPQWP